MPKFLIEHSHEPQALACARVVNVFLQTGSHFLTHADWGCLDGDHRAWIIVDAESKDEVRAIVPPPFRSEARIVGLNQFMPEQIDDILRDHGAVIGRR